MSKYKVHGRIGNSLKSVEMDRGDFSIDRLKSKFGQVLGYGVAVQYVSSLGQGSVASDKQLEEALLDSAKRGKRNLEVVLIKDGSNVKSIGNFVPQTTSRPSNTSSSNTSSNNNYSSNNNSNTSSSQTRNNNTSSNNSSNNYSSSSNSNTSSYKGSGQLDSDLQREINIARTNPSVYIKLLEERANSFEGNVLFVKKGELKYKTKTNEGKDAVLEAIQALRSLSRLDGYSYPRTLCSCALEVANKIGTKPVDKNQFAQIIESHGTYNGELKLLRGHFYEQDDAQDLVIHFLVSDGDKNRTSRNILLSTNLGTAGIGIVDGEFPRLCTLMFSSSWN